MIRVHRLFRKEKKKTPYTFVNNCRIFSSQSGIYYSLNFNWNLACLNVITNISSKNRSGLKCKTSDINNGKGLIPVWDKLECYHWFEDHTRFSSGLISMCQYGRNH